MTEWIWESPTNWKSRGLVTLADKGYQGSKWAKVGHTRGATPRRLTRLEELKGRLPHRRQPAHGWVARSSRALPEDQLSLQ
jgi:hypothetical protein